MLTNALMHECSVAGGKGFQQFCKVADIFLKAPDVEWCFGTVVSKYRTWNGNDRTKRPASGLKRKPWGCVVEGLTIILFF